MSELRLTEAAVRDISEIEQFSAAEFGSEQTAEYLAGLRESFGRLRDYPGLGIVRDDLRRGTRSHRYRSHRIYYRLGRNELVIQRVLHYARMVRRDMLK